MFCIAIFIGVCASVTIIVVKLVSTDADAYRAIDPYNTLDTAITWLRLRITEGEYEVSV